MSTMATMIEQDLRYHRYVARTFTGLSLVLGFGAFVFLLPRCTLAGVPLLLGWGLIILGVSKLLAKVSSISCFTSLAANIGTNRRWVQKVKQISGTMLLLVWPMLCFHVVHTNHERHLGLVLVELTFIASSFVFLALRHRMVVKLIEQVVAPRPTWLPLAKQSSQGSYQDMRLSIADCNCPVCGQGFADETPVFCGRCNTPHHPDCFEFTGHCSVFGCDGKANQAAP